MKKIVLFFALFCLPQLFAQSAESVWSKFYFLEGEWKGGGGGTPGAGEGSFSFQFQLDRNIIVRKSLTIFPATQYSIEKTHEDLMIIYPDGKNGLEAIYFDDEGHRINYRVNFEGSDIVFTSDKKEDSPVFRLTYHAVGEKNVRITFEISTDGTNYKKYLEGDAVKN